MSRFYKDLKLEVIPAGSKSLNPSDVLGSERMKELISHLGQTFDYVVLDTPPVSPVIDSVILANLADKTIFVVQWATTPRELIETCIRQLSTQKRVAGVVFNFINQARAKKYGSPYSYGQAYEKYYSRMSTFSGLLEALLKYAREQTVTHTICVLTIEWVLI